MQNGTALDQVGSLVSELIQVRNTFIHVEDEVPIDQRNMVAPGELDRELHDEPCAFLPLSD